MIARHRSIIWATTVLAILYGIADAIRLAWVCDDAFISFRYAKNLASGIGLVYNAGERVEGYSNFLWTLLLSGALGLGADPVVFSKVGGLLCFAATMGLLLRTSFRIARERGDAAFAVPVAAIALSMHHHLKVFATGGLETSLFTLLTTAVVIVTVEAAGPRGYLLAGSLAALAALTRPDGALLLLVPMLGASLDLLGRRDGRPRPILFAAVPMMLVYVPYLLWKRAYYGDLLPNTYHAKAANLPYYEQGLLYTGLYFLSYYVLAAGLGGLAWGLVRGWGGRDERRPWSSARGPALVLVTCLLYLLFVVRVGGDFMFARFCLPVTPLLLLGAELLCLHVPVPRYRLLCGALVVLGTYFSWYPAEITRLGNRTGIVEERFFYPPATIREARRLGEMLRRLTAGVPTKVAIYGSQAMLAYYAEFPVVIEAHTGLTDRAIARLPVSGRGRVGHEKAASLPYLRQRGVDFVFSFGLFHARPTPVSRIQIGEASGMIVAYRRGVMDPLKTREEIELVDFERFLDDYIARMAERSPEQIERDYEEFEAYYFDHNRDPVRQAAFLSKLPVKSP